MKKVSYCAVAVAMALLPGCSSFRSVWADRYGPDPVLSETASADAASRQIDVVTTFLRVNGYARAGVENDLPTNNPAWYGVILTGFNTVDDACQTYINDLWKIDRQKNRTKDMITASAAATAAIVGANADPSAATLTTLAQAFGLASALTGTLGDSYLFAQDPASVGQIVKKLQVAYRNDLAKNIDTKNYPISSYAAVYYHTREYLSLCLPPTIQAQVQDLIAKAKANAEPPAPNALLTTRTLSSSSVTTSGKATSSVSLTPSGG